jgi:MFS family permease
LIIAVGVVTAGQIYKLAPTLPMVRAELGLSLLQGGWLFSIISATTALTGFLAGSVADGIGMRRTLLVGLVVIAITSAGGAVTDQFEPALLLRFCEGLGVLAVVSAAPTLIIGLTTPAQRSLALAAWPVYMPLGAAVAATFGGWGVALIGWRGIWWAMAALSLLSAVAVARWIGAAVTPPAIPARELTHHLWATLRNPAVLILGGVMLAFTAVYGPFIAWLPTYLVEQQGFGADRAGAIAGGVVLMNIGGNLGTGWLLARSLRHWQILALAGTVMLIAIVLLFAPAAPDPLRLFGALLLTGFSGLVPGAVYTAIPLYARDALKVGAINGLIIQGAQLGHVVGPPVIAWLVSRADGDWSVGFGYYLALSAGIILLALALRRLPGAQARP